MQGIKQSWENVEQALHTWRPLARRRTALLGRRHLQIVRSFPRLPGRPYPDGRVPIHRVTSFFPSSAVTTRTASWTPFSPARRWARRRSRQKRPTEPSRKRSEVSHDDDDDDVRVLHYVRSRICPVVSSGFRKILTRRAVEHRTIDPTRPQFRPQHSEIMSEEDG